MIDRSSHLKLGVLVLVALAISGWLVLRIENFTIGRNGGKSFFVTLPNGQGLAAKSPVLLRGVRVGRVTALALDGEGVRATVIVEQAVQLHEGAQAQVSSVGLLGEKQLDLDSGDLRAPLLAEGAVIQGGNSVSLDDVFARLADITGDVKEVTGSVKGALSEDRLAALLLQMTALVTQIEQLVGTNQEGVRQGVAGMNEVIRGIAKLEKQLLALSARETGTGGSGGEGLDAGPSLAEQLRGIVDNLDAISTKVRAGEGSLGKLVESDTTAQKLDATLDTANQSLGGVSSSLGFFQKTRVGIGLRGEYLTATETSKAGAILEVLPPSPAFLRLELVSLADADAPGVRALAYSAQGGYRFPHLAVRGGVIESRPGLGADLFGLSDRLRLTAEAWDSAKENTRPHARVEAAVSPLRWFSLVSGWDDPLNRRDGLDSFFLGGRLQLVPEKKE